MKRSLLKILVVILLIFLPVILHQTYRWMTALPRQITIAAGHPEGRYHGMAVQLKTMLEQRLPVDVKVLETKGSLENLELVRQGKVDLGFYQPGTEYALAALEPAKQAQPKLLVSPEDQIGFIANLYSQVMHVIVPADSGIESVRDLKGRRIAIGDQGSGDLAASLPLLRHLQLSLDQIEPAYLSYQEIEEQFGKKTLDAAIVTVGIEAPVLHDLLETGNYRILEIPFTGALTRKASHFYEYEIPAGMFRTQEPIVPENNLQTVACGAHLLTKGSTPDALIAEVTAIILHQNFSRQMHLNELFAAGHEFAQDNQGFPVHSGADHVYNPELKPFLNSDFVEATEGMRSFLVSVLIAAYLLFRWFQKRRSKAKEHRLDRFIRQLVEIENKQMQLDGNNQDDGPALQRLLDDVTSLRQGTLEQFSAHELNEDRATDAFLEMCHALSDKINAKLLGWKIDRLGEKISKS
ncbi:alkanesulfonate transporter substrate-binding subunit [Gimesia alba]|uniref:Alkanesulfonate transporter substrate-binding subunit n=1 Tax=Gimesia alba TaxID=2527973 RepID=A0A517R962_9PLAN|nr:TAXI family TRAP transporter solute-binding subunit [Gimesia alba]QDT40405.1 alkanesulfonate transporter substrate-binding subunit [Gimesia alba]